MNVTHLKAASRDLGRVIARLEAWQAKYPSRDALGAAASAKSDLMRLMRLIDEDVNLRSRPTPGDTSA